MRFSLFPASVYTLKSFMCAGDIVKVLDDNLMEEEWFTIDFLTEILDRKMGVYRYFEGKINGNRFEIKYKRYQNFHGSLPLFVIVPRIFGEISDHENSSIIRIRTGVENPGVVLTIYFLAISVLCFAPIPGGFKIFYIVISVMAILLANFGYKKRIRKDKDQ